MNFASFASVDQLMCTAVEERIFPGAVLLVSCRGKTVFHRPYGWADLFSRRTMSADTIFDLASLTKPLATTLAVMLLVQQGRMHLDSACYHFCPCLERTDLGRLSIRQLLSHRSGLPAFRPYHLRLRLLEPQKRRLSMHSMLLQEQLRPDGRGRAEYSDLGFMVLQWLVEETTGEDLACYLHNHIYKKLGIKKLFFVGEKRSLPVTWFAATELCPIRKRLIVGSVHDDNAAALGGIAGHAGLFGSSRAVADVLQGLMEGEEHGHPLFEGELIRSFFERQDGDTWALGFDTPSSQNSSAGCFFSSSSVGHLGFTGTSFWMDRRNGVICILLSNRVHPSRYNTRIKVFRPALHNAVMEALGIH